MNRFYNLFILFCLSFGIHSVVNAQRVIELNDMSFKTIQSEAARANKPFFVFLYESGETNHLRLEDKLTQSESLGSLLKRDFLFAKSDIQHNEWDGCDYILGIENLPCIVVFKKDGTPFHLIKDGASSQELMADFMTVKGYMSIPNYYPKEGTHYLKSDRVAPVSQGSVNDFANLYDVKANTTEYIVADQPVKTPASSFTNDDQVQKPNPVPAYNSTELIADINRTIPKNVTPTVKAVTPKPAPGGGAGPKERFVVQFNSFDNEVLALNNKQELQKRLPEFEFIVVKAIVNNAVKFRVLTGDFKNLQEADAKCKEIKRFTGLEVFANKIAL